MEPSRENMGGLETSTPADIATAVAAPEAAAEPEWKTFLPTKDGVWGRNIAGKMDIVLNNSSIQGVDNDALRNVRDNFDVERFDDLPFMEDNQLLEMFREVRHDLIRMLGTTVDPRDPAFETPEQANSALYTIAQKLSPYMKQQ